MIKNKTTFIVGGGSCRLSAAYHLKNDYYLIEKYKEVGGTARSVKTKGFTF